MLYMYRVDTAKKDIERRIVFRATAVLVFEEGPHDRVFRKTKAVVWCNTYAEAKRYLAAEEDKNNETERAKNLKKLEEARELVSKVRGYRDREKNPELRQRFIDELVDLWVRIDNLKKIVG